MNEDDWLEAAYEDRWEIDGDEEYDAGDDFDSGEDADDNDRPISMLDLALHRGVQADEYERIPASEFTRVGIATLGGCAVCHATIAVYNAYPSKSGFWKCGDCIGDSGWDNIVEANNQIFDEAEGEE